MLKFYFCMAKLNTLLHFIKCVNNLSALKFCLLAIECVKAMNFEEIRTWASKNQNLNRFK